MKRILKLAFTGAGLSLSAFLGYMIFYDLKNGGNIVFYNHDFLKAIIAIMIIGLGYSVPGIIYESEKFSYLVKSFIHMGTGFLIMLITGYVSGWYSLDQGVGRVVMMLFLQVMSALVIWRILVYRDIKAAKKINDRIAELEKE